MSYESLSAKIGGRTFNEEKTLAISGKTRGTREIKIAICYQFIKTNMSDVMTQNRRWRTWLARGVVVIVSIGFALSVSELYLRRIEFDLNPAEHWRYDRMFGWTADYKHAPHDRVTEQGFRYVNWGRGDSEPPRKILLLGDSFTHASGMPYASTYSSHLETALNGQHKDYRGWAAVNLSVGDWGPGQELIALQEYRAKFDPELVVLQFFPFNDVPNCALSMAGTASMQDHHRPYWIECNHELQITFQHPWRTKLRNNFLVFGLFENLVTPHQRLLPRPNVSVEELQAARHTYFERNARRRGLTETGMLYSLMPEVHQPPAVKEAWAITERVVTQMVDVAHQGNTPVIALVIPYRNTVGPMWDEFIARIRPAVQNKLQQDYCTARLEKFLTDLGVPTISIREKIYENGLAGTWMFLDDGHFNALGHRQVADWVLEKIHHTTEIKVLDTVTQDESIAIDFIADPAGVAMIGLDPNVNSAHTPHLMAHGPAATVKFVAHQAEHAILDLQAYSIVPDQSIEVFVNGISLSKLTQLPEKKPSAKWQIPLEVNAGPNEVRLQFADWNHRSITYFPKETRPLAANLLRFAVVAQGDDLERGID